MALPTHRYIPTLNKRHPEGAFDEIRNSVRAGMTPDEVGSSDAFEAGMLFFEAGYYWEAHEVLEAVWLVLPPESAERHFVQGLIQLANGYLKLEMKRPKAALRLSSIATQLFESSDGEGRLFQQRSRLVTKAFDLKKLANDEI